MGTMGMVIRRGLGELGPFLFVVRRRAPVFGIQVRGLGDIVFLRALLDGLPLVLRRRNLVPRTVNGTGHTGPSEFCATSI